MDNQLSNVMDTLQTQDGQVMADSRDVAKFFGKEHHNVIKAIRNLDCDEEFGAVNFNATSYIDSWNREKSAYLMTKKGFTFLAMGFTGKKAAEFKIAYIEAFEQMEAKLRQLSTPQTYIEALRETLRLAEEKEALSLENKELNDQKDRLEKAKGNKSFTEAAKILGVKRKDLILWMEENGWVYRNVRKDLVAYQDKIDSGLMQHSGGESNGIMFSQAKLTPKGISKLNESNIN